MKRDRYVGAAMAAVLAAGCADGFAPAPRETAAVFFAVQGSAATRTVAVEITGPGIDSLLLFNIAVDLNGTGSGTAQVPAGAQRQIVLRAFDAFGNNTHRGDTTVTLAAGPNPQFNIVLRPLTGSLPIVVTFGGSGVTITPGDTVIAAGDTVRYTGGGVDSLGAVIPAAAIVWSSTNPAVASLSGQGLVTGRGAGTAFVLATFGGASVGRQVVVQ